MSHFIPLPERRLLIVAGKDAAHFLHNLLTANIETLKPGQMRPAALLTPQGKIIAEMLVANAGEEGDAEGLFLLDVGVGFADPLLEKLAQYKLRAEVTLGHAPAGTSVAALLDAPDFSSDEVYVFADPRHAGLGLRLVGPEAALAAIGEGFDKAAPEAYHLRRTALGVPEMGKDYPALDAFPMRFCWINSRASTFARAAISGRKWSAAWSIAARRARVQCPCASRTVSG